VTSQLTVPPAGTGPAGTGAAGTGLGIRPEAGALARPLPGAGGRTPRPARSGPLRVATVIARLEGGAGVLALRGALAMDPQTCRVTIITGQGDQLIAAARAGGLEVVVEPALRAPVRPASDLRALRRLTALFADRDFDVVHTHCAKAGAVGRVAARRAGVGRIIHTFHGFPFHEFQPRALRHAYVSIERRLGRITDVALCVGAGVAAEAIRRELVAPDRVRTMGVSVDGPDRVRASREAGTSLARRRARAALGLPADARVVGAVGRLTYQKAPEDFVTALGTLGRPDVIGMWVGGGELAARVTRHARGLPAGRFRLAGERADVLDILPAFDVFALPSRYEGLPTAIVEAMICGVPVVATAVNAVPDLVIPGETGSLVPPGRPDLMATAIGHLLDSPVAAARMAAAARGRIDGRYGEAALRDSLLAAYDLDAPVQASCEAAPPRSAGVTDGLAVEVAAGPAGPAEPAGPAAGPAGLGRPGRPGRPARRGRPVRQSGCPAWPPRPVLARGPGLGAGHAPRPG
jgi:glycosyltransferase involved in cell wall biosynthesis